MRSVSSSIVLGFFRDPGLGLDLLDRAAFQHLVDPPVPGGAGVHRRAELLGYLGVVASMYFSASSW